MGLRQRIEKMMRRQVAPQTTTLMPAPRAESAGLEAAQRFRAERERREVIRVCREMYERDPRVSKMHRMLARDMVRSGFVILTEHEAAAREAAALDVRIGLRKKLDDYVRLTARDGDSFLEVEVNEGLDIVGLSRKPTLQMRRNSNAQDKFDDPARAFWLASEMHTGDEPPRDAVWFAEWQIIHARWGHDEENRYGTPMMKSGISAYKRVREGETDIAVRRKTGAGQIREHVIENGSEADIEAYKKRNAAALQKPFAAVTNIFTNKRDTIKIHQGDVTLHQIGDVLHHIATMFAAGDVPMELVAYGEGLNRDILGEKKAAYEATLTAGRDWIETEIIRPLLERQWLLKGILPESVEYKIVWRTAYQLSPADLRDVTDAAMRLRLLGVDERVIRSVLAQVLPGVDADLLANDEAIDTERFAAMLKGLSV